MPKQKQLAITRVDEDHTENDACNRLYSCFLYFHSWESHDGALSNTVGGGTEIMHDKVVQRSP